MATYSITITFEDNKTQEFIINGTEAAYAVYRRAVDLAELVGNKVELWVSEDEGNKWEQLEEEEF